MTQMNAVLSESVTRGSTSNNQSSNGTLVSFGNTSYISAANTAFKNQTNANANSYNQILSSVGSLSFNNYPNYVNTGSATAVNYNSLYVQGLLPVMFGMSTRDFYIPLTQNASANFKQAATLSQNSSNFLGSGVKVSIIDGITNVTHGGLSGQNFTNIAVDNQYQGATEADKILLGVTVTTENSKTVYASSEHGTKVALILAGKRDSTYSGLLPNANVSYTQLTTGSTLYFDKVYEKVYTDFKPSIINNSYTFGNPNSTELATNIDGLDKIQRTSYTSALSGLKSVSKNADTPLFVFTTGNYNATAWYQEKYTSNNSVVNTSNWSDVNWGATADTASGLYNAIIADVNISNSLIAVTGWGLNANNEISNLVNATKNNVSNTSKLTTTTTSTSSSITFSPEMIVLGASGNSTALTRAIGCGEVKWSCLAGTYGYVIANYTSNQQISFSGTSAAAPQVSAVAGMVKEQFSFMTASNLKTTLLTTAYDVGEAGVDDVFGWGVVDAAMALNGPAAFVFGNFTANLAGTNKRFYFNNNITGSNGLIVNGTSNQDQLVLTGYNNTYTGNTVVNGGALILQDKASVGIVNSTNAATNNTVSLASNIYVNNAGNLYAYNSVVNGSVVNNGYTEVENVVFKSFENKENATVAINLSAPLQVNGTAKLNGTLAITNASSYVKTGSTVNYTAIKAGYVSGSFSKYYVGSGAAALADYSLHSNSTNVVVSVKAKSATSYAATTSATVSSTDATSLVSGATVVDRLLSAADRVVLVDAGTTSTTNVLLTAAAATNMATSSTVGQGVTTASYYSNLDLTDVYTNSTTAASAAAVTTSLQEYATAQAASTANELALVNSVTTADSQTALTTTASLTADTTPNTTASTIVTSQSTLTDLTAASPTTQTSQVITTPTLQASSVSTTTLTADNSSTLLATAATIQNLNAQELNALLYRAAGTLYANSQLAVAQANYEQSLGFAKVATSRLATTDHDWHTYANYSYNRDAWSSNATTAKGRLSSNEVTIGAYTQTLDGFNLGAAVHTAKRKWQEGRNDAQNLSDAYADINSFGLTFSAGKAYANYYLAGTLFIDANRFKVDRTVLNANDLHARFNSYTAGADLKGGFLAIGNLDDGVVVEGGIAYLMNRQSAFSETAASTTSNLLAFQAKARTNSQLYAHTAVKAYSSFKVFGLVSQVDATLDLNARLAGSAFTLKLQNGATTGTAFNNKFLARLELGYAIQVTNGLKLRLAGAYAKASEWSRKQANLSLDYKF